MLNGPYFESYYTWAASCIECDHDGPVLRHFRSKELCKPEWICSLHTTRKYGRSSLWRTIIKNHWAASSRAPDIQILLERISKLNALLDPIWLAAGDVMRRCRTANTSRHQGTGKGTGSRCLYDLRRALLINCTNCFRLGDWDSEGRT